MNDETKEALEETTVSETEVELQSAVGKKRRWLKKVLIALGIVVVCFFIVFAFFLGPIVKFGANAVGASLLGVDQCRIGSAKIFPFGGYVRFENIVLGKPQAKGLGFSHDLLSVALIEIDVDMFSLLGKKKILDRFEIQSLTVNYERLLTGETNVDVLMENLLGKPVADMDTKEVILPAKQAEKSTTIPAEEIFVGARYFVIEKVQVKAHLRGLPVMLPAMSTHFREGIGIDDDLTPNAFGVKVAGNFMSAIDAFQDSVLGDAAGVAADAVSSVAGKTEDAAIAAAGATVDAVSDTAGAVVNFFSNSSSEKEKNKTKEKK